MSDDVPLRPQRSWFYAQPPIAFSLTPEGALWIEFDMAVHGAPPAHLGLHIPAEELEALRKGLEMTQTIRETLSAKPPAQGAH